MHVTPQCGSLTGRFEMISFEMLIYNLLKYKMDLYRPKPLKVSKDENLKEPKVGLM